MCCFQPIKTTCRSLSLLALKCKKDDVVRANQFEVKVRVTGDNLAGLGAKMKAKSRLNVLNR